MSSGLKTSPEKSIQAGSAGSSGALADLVRLCRPRQWTKNLICLAPLLFAHKACEPAALALSLLCFLALCLASSAVYLANDLLDADLDRLHPVKRDRPLAAGRVSRGIAAVLSVVLCGTALLLATLVSLELAFVILAYALVCLSYSIVFKHVLFVDVFAIAIGFVLRAVSGAVAIAVPSSSWFLLCTSLGALFLALEKRRQERVTLKDESPAHRPVLADYTPALVDKLQSFILPSLLCCYIFYSFLSIHGQAMMLTVPFVIYGVMRYQYLVGRACGLTATPEEVLLKDRPTQVNLLLWLAMAAGVVYIL